MHYPDEAQSRTMKPRLSDETLSSPTGGAQPRHPFPAVLIDPHGLWSAPLDVLPSFDGRVQWLRSTTPWPPETDGLSIRLANSSAECQSGAERWTGCVTALVDAAVPIGLHGCSAILACSHDTMSTAVVAMATAILTVALANHIAHFGWSDAREIISRDVLMVAAPMHAADADTISGCAARTLGYFQGTSRIEPEAVILGIIASDKEPPGLRDMTDFAHSIRSMSGLTCYQIVACHLSKQAHATAFLLATFPIPALPGQRIRARRRWPT